MKHVCDGNGGNRIGCPGADAPMKKAVGPCPIGSLRGAGLNACNGRWVEKVAGPFCGSKIEQVATDACTEEHPEPRNGRVGGSFVGVAQDGFSVLRCCQPSQPDQSHEDKAEKEPAQVMGHKVMYALEFAEPLLGIEQEKDCGPDEEDNGDKKDGFVQAARIERGGS